MGVALEPYLFNLLVSPAVSSAGFLDTASQYYAVNIGMVFFFQAGMSLLNFRKGLVPGPAQEHSRVLAVGLGISGGIFLLSAVPLFGTLTVFSIPLRYILWGSVFARRLIARRSAKGGTGPAPPDRSPA